MKSEAKANEFLADSVRDMLAEQKRWADVLAKPTVKREVKPVQKVSFFSRLFKVA